MVRCCAGWMRQRRERLVTRTSWRRPRRQRMVPSPCCPTPTSPFKFACPLPHTALATQVASVATDLARCVRVHRRPIRDSHMPTVSCMPCRLRGEQAAFDTTRARCGELGDEVRRISHPQVSARSHVTRHGHRQLAAVHALNEQLRLQLLEVRGAACLRQHACHACTLVRPDGECPCAL